MLPYGYSVSLLISIFPYIWKKIIDPMAISINKGEKITAEAKESVERWVGEIQRHAHPEVRVVLIGCKEDIDEEGNTVKRKIELKQKHNENLHC